MRQYEAYDLLLFAALSARLLLGRWRLPHRITGHAAGIRKQRSALLHPLAGDAPRTDVGSRLLSAVTEQPLVTVQLGLSAFGLLFAANGAADFPDAVLRNHLLTVFVIDGALGMQLPRIQHQTESVGTAQGTAWLEGLGLGGLGGSTWHRSQQNKREGEPTK